LVARKHPQTPGMSQHRPVPLSQLSVHDVNLTSEGDKSADVRLRCQKSHMKKRKAEIDLWDASDALANR